MRKGIVFLLLSAFLFALSTVFVKVITLQSNIPALEITSCRFLINFLVLLIYVRIKRKPLRPNRPDYIIVRAILNFGTVSFWNTKRAIKRLRFQTTKREPKGALRHGI